MKNLLLFVALSLVFSGCEQFKNPENPPCYLSLDSYTMTTNYGLEGTDRQKIEMVHVYIDDQNIGTFDLPALIPVLWEGDHELKIYPGIYENGITETGFTYAFMQPYVETLNFIPDSTITILPNFKYNENCVFWLEDFEDPAVKFDTDPTVGYGITLTDDANEVFEKNYSAKVELDETNNRFKIVSQSLTNLPKNAAEVYLEVHVKTDNTILFSTIAGNSGGESVAPFYVITPSTEWRKFYFNLKENISYEVNATYYKMSFESILDDENTSATVYFDNFKIIYAD